MTKSFQLVTGLVVLGAIVFLGSFAVLGSYRQAKQEHRRRAPLYLAGNAAWWALNQRETKQRWPTAAELEVYLQNSNLFENTVAKYVRVARYREGSCLAIDLEFPEAELRNAGFVCCFSPKSKTDKTTWHWALDSKGTLLGERPSVTELKKFENAK